MDQCMYIGRVGMFNIIRKEWSIWNIKEQGNLVADLKMRGVDDVEALPAYHYRDDALLLWNAMQKYIAIVVNSVYGNPINDRWIDKLVSKWHVLILPLAYTAIAVDTCCHCYRCVMPL